MSHTVQKEKDYLMARCIPEPNSGCWLWLGSARCGYGTTSIDYVVELAHRLSFKVFNGPIKENNIVRHMCHNTYCINPEHLKQGTHIDNVQDTVRKIRAQRRLKNSDYEWWLP